MKFAHLCQKYVLDNGHLGGPGQVVGCHWSHQSPLSHVIVPGVRFCRISRNFSARPLSFSMFSMFYVPLICI
jgi:hypothetical protein